MAYDPELERFKTEIDLRDFAAAQSYVKIPKDSTKTGVSTAMRHPVTDDKIIIRRNANGHWIYACAYDDSDAGTIIDFIRNRRGSHLGDIRRELREWLGSTPAAPPMTYTGSRAEKSLADRPAILKFCETLHVAQEQPYLKTRAIGHRELLTHQRFRGRIHNDPKHGAACFLFEDGQGVCGVEMRNEGFKGFVPGSEKGIWRSNCFKEDKTLVFTEGVINAISYHALYPDNRTRYMALGGGWSEKTKQLLESAAMKHPGQTIILAFDNDKQGIKYEAKARELIAKLGKEIIAHFPENPGIDWNKQLANALEQQQQENTHRERLHKRNNSEYKGR